MQRLLKRADFLAAARGKRFHTARMSVQGRARAEADIAAGLRVGFTLTKKVGHSTERNRIRRRLRNAAAEAARPFADRPVDVVVIGRIDAISAPFDLLLSDLGRALAAVTKVSSSAATTPHPSARTPSQRGDHV